MNLTGRQFSLGALLAWVTGLCLGVGLLVHYTLPAMLKMSMFGLLGVIGLSLGLLMVLCSVGVAVVLCKKR